VALNLLRAAERYGPPPGGEQQPATKEWRRTQLLKLPPIRPQPSSAEYNLANVARGAELKVMNLSALVIALRPEVQPGDALQLKNRARGQGSRSGVGNLEDWHHGCGGAARKSGSPTAAVTVNRALQTSTAAWSFLPAAIQTFQEGLWFAHSWPRASSA